MAVVAGTRGLEFDASGRLVEWRVVEAVREYQRLKWLIEHLGPEDRTRSVDEYAMWLSHPPDWPGKHERAIAALAVHVDPEGRAILRDWTPPRHLALLRRIALTSGSTAL